MAKTSTTAAQMKEFNFHSIKIDAEGKATLSYDRKLDGDHSTSIDKETPDGIAHQDFIAALQSIAVHAVIYAEYLPAAKVKNLETEQSTSKEVEKFRVGTLNFGEKKGGTSYVIISGTRIQETGRAFNFTLPQLQLNTPEEGEKYKFLDELNKALKEVKKEAIAFIGGKYTVDPQGDLFKEHEETK